MGIAKGCGVQLIGILLFLVLVTKSSWLAMTVLLVFAIGGLLYGLIDSAKKTQDLKTEIRLKMKIVRPLKEDFAATRFFVSNNYETRIDIDNNKKLLGLYRNKMKNIKFLSPTFSKYNFEFLKIPYKDILSVEIVVDGDSVTKTSRSSQLGGAIVGGMIAGGVGAIIGGTTGTKNTKEKVKQIDLLITVKNVHNPIYIINFYSEIDAEKQTTNPKDAMLKCKEWYGILTHIIDKGEIKPSVDKEVSVKENTTLTDRLKELNQLKLDGVIEEVEFEEQRKRILNEL